MKYLIALSFLAASTLAQADYVLTPSECEGAAQAAGKIAYERKNGKTSEQVIAEIEAERDAFPREELVDLAKDLVHWLYATDVDLEPQAAYNGFRHLCFEVEGRIPAHTNQ